PAGMGGSAQSAAARARTRAASLIVIPPGRSARTWLPPGVATTRSTVPAAAQSGIPADAVTPGAGPVEPPAPAEAGCAAFPATVLLPHAVRPIRAPAAISASAPRVAVPSGTPCPPAVPFGLPGLTIAGSLRCHGPAQAGHVGR